MTIDELDAVTGEIYNAADVERLAELHNAIKATTDDGSARAAAVIGDAHLIAYKLGYDVADLAAARARLEKAVALEPLPVRRVNLAVALLEHAVMPGRGDRDASREDYWRGVQLLDEALAETPRADPRWVDRATLLLSARLSAVNVALFGADVESALAFGEEVVGEAQRSGLGNGEPENLLAGGLLLHVGNGGDSSGLNRAVKLYRQAIARLPDGHPDRPLRQSNLSGALLDRYEFGGDPQDRDDSLTEARTAFAAIDVRDPRRPAAANNLLNVLLVVARETTARDVLEEAFGVIPVLRRAYRDGDPLYATMLDNLANAALEIYAATGRREDLDAASHFRQEAVRVTEEGDPARAWRVVLMSIDCSRQALDDRDVGVAEQGVRLGLTSLAHVRAEDDAARLASSLATIAYDLFLLGGRVDYLNLAAALHLSGLPLLADGSPAVANLSNNAGLALLDRFERLGDVEDLAAAVDAHELAVRNTPPEHRDYATRRMNLATAYHRGYGASGDPRELDRAENEARAAVQAAHTSEIRVAARGTLVDVLRRRFTDGDARTYHELRDYLDESAPDSDRAIESLRRAYVARDIGADIDRLESLRDAMTTGLRDRPSVALAAARELAADGLALQVGGSSEGASVVADAVAVAGQALARMTADGEPRHLLSWSQDTYGLAAVAAQSLLLAGNAPAAELAFESGHARLVGQLRGAVTSDLVVRVWATVGGGGAVVGTGEDARGIELAELKRSAVERWSRRIAIASRLGAGALEPVLATVLREAGDLLAPLLESIPAGEPLVWCAGGLLSSLPIGAVPVDGVVLLERNPLRQAATGAIAGWAEAKAHTRPLEFEAAWSVAAPAPSAHPPLPGAEREARAFAPSAQRLLAERATIAAAKHALIAGRLVHFACHARTSAADPLANHLLLAADEPLFADEVLKLESQARLVVLAACDTADVGAAHADEALGLASALHLAGVPGVIASLWPVYDEETASLMVVLGEALRRGQAPLNALRAVVLEARAAGMRQATTAAFALFGA